MFGYLFYIKRIRAGRYKIGIAPNRSTARTYGGTGRIIYSIRGWDHAVVLPWLRWAEHKFRNCKSGEYYDLGTAPARKLLGLVKLQLDQRRLRPTTVLLHLIVIGFWWLHRAWVWLLFSLRGRRHLLHKWEIARQYPAPPYCKAEREPYHFKVQGLPVWVQPCCRNLSNIVRWIFHAITKSYETKGTK